MAREYDLVVIGAGPAGNTVAPMCREAGLSVAMTESIAYGGTCPLRGCNPKKVLVGAAEIMHRIRLMEGRGVTGGSGIAWKELQEFKRSFTEPIPEEVEKAFGRRGIDLYHGAGRFVDPGTVEVAGQELTGKYFFVGTGAVPAPLPIHGAEHLTMSDRFMELDELPESILFVGAGYISMEFSHVAAMAGARVTVVEALDRVLGGFDKDMANRLVNASEEMGIDVHVSMPVQSIEKEGAEYLVRAGENGEREFRADLVVHGAGRLPAVEGLGLEQAGVDATKKGITVNEYMQSVSNSDVFAAGDCVDTPHMLTPTAAVEAEAAARNIIEGKNVQAVDMKVVPSAVFTLPPLAMVGELEEDLDDRGVDYDFLFEDTSSWFSAARIGLKHQAVKILFEEDSGRILGAHMIGHHAEEMVNVFSLAMRHGITLEGLRQTLWAYPTSIYDLRNVIA
jgi:glutathione reductase (NADPH)